ncbi:superoxide dismutase [Phreatobacter aquaticus]|uniref:Superoxide dismutase n=1 Tax=Phreatobacter aquaticus TaxID=2570229 RepID=A0A4D7QGR4_9HYPH|nr:superoxide dismutase [Phreatobacter aquaticus]QCK87040.1 superoxide dismutase [Phreatobacter aquaticus]
MNRRLALKLFGAAAIGATLPIPAAHRVFAQAASGPFTLPPLGYAYEALEPHIDTQTMTIHHQRHEGAFIGNLNTFAGQYAALKPDTIEPVLRKLSDVPEGIRTGVRNNAGGLWNHVFFWDIMTPGGAKEATGTLAAAINSTFGDHAKFRQQFQASAVGRFGSGWAWLVVDKDGKLAIVSTPNQDNPLMDGVKGVVLGVDVWEHAYYLKYQNRRPDYVTSWWNTVNWTKAQANFAKAMG